MRWSRIALVTPTCLVACQLLLNDGEPDAKQDASSQDDGGGADVTLGDVVATGDAAVDALLVEDAGPCDDVASNPKHCGQCGHDCLGGACSDGGCVPFTLVDASNPHALAMDDTHLYFAVGTSPSHIESIAKTGGGVLALTDDQAVLDFIIAEPPYVYYSGDYVKRRRTDGTGSVEQVCPNNAPAGLGPFAFWGAELYAAVPYVTSTVWVCTKEPGPSAFTLAINIEQPTAMVGAAPHGVFFGDSVTPQNGGPFVRRYSGSGNIVGIAAGSIYRAVADDTSLWYSRVGEASVFRVPLDAPNLAQPDSGIIDRSPTAQGNAGELAVDATHVYWLTVEASGFLHRMPRSGGNVETMVVDVRRGAGLAVDDKRVCWGERDLARIRCLAK